MLVASQPPKSCTESMLGGSFEAQRKLLLRTPQVKMPSVRNSEARRFPAQTQLSDTLVVWLCLGSVRPLCPVLIIRAASLWDADGFVARICAVQDGVFPRLGLVGLAVDISDGGVEVAGGGGRDEALDLCDAAVVVLFVVLVHSIVTVCFVNCRVHCRLKNREHRFFIILEKQNYIY